MNAEGPFLDKPMGKECTGDAVSPAINTQLMILEPPKTPLNASI